MKSHSNESEELRNALAEFAIVQAELNEAIRATREALYGPEPKRLSCGCYGKCDPYAHDTAPDWDGTPDGPDYRRCVVCDAKIYEGQDGCEACQFEGLYALRHEAVGSSVYSVMEFSYALRWRYDSEGNFELEWPVGSFRD